jgi:hypothetical protein
MRCRHCGRLNPKTASYCLNCGEALPLDPKRGSMNRGSVNRNGEEYPAEPDSEEHHRPGEEAAQVKPSQPPRGISAWKVSTAILCVLVIILLVTTVVFAIRARDREERVEVLSARNEELSGENTGLLLALKSVETVSRKAAQVIDKYFREDEEEDDWLGYLVDALETIEGLSRAYQNVVESGESDGSLLEKVENLVDEFLNLEPEER